MTATVTGPKTATTPEQQQLHNQVEQICRTLRLPHLRKAAAEVLPAARSQRWDPAETVRVLLAAEADGRAAATIRNRRKAAGFPAGKTLDSWDSKASSIPTAVQQALRTLEWVGRTENLCIAGPSGTGKSHFLEALGHHAIKQGLKVTWTTLEGLGQLVRRHRVDDSIGKAIGRLLRTDLIVVDLCLLRDYADPVVQGAARLGSGPEGVGIVRGFGGTRGGCRVAGIGLG